MLKPIHVADLSTGPIMALIRFPGYDKEAIEERVKVHQ